MEPEKKDTREKETGEEATTATLIREVIQEFLETQKARAEPAVKAELGEERRRREQLERRVNELVEENQRSRRRTEEVEREASIRAELLRLGVSKVELAYKAVKDEIVRGEDGRLVVKTGGGEREAQEYLAQFVHENPELLPARMAGGSGSGSGQRVGGGGGGVDLDKIRPGMSAEELQRAREEIMRVVLHTQKGI